MSDTPALSFTRAEFEGQPPPADTCAFCKRGLETEYYRVNQHLACVACARQAESLVPPDSHKAFTKAVLYGAGAAVLGCIGYALFQILSGIMIGWIAVGVGFGVAWAMRKGSGGLGGRRYQIAAALLTYAAVAVAFVPVALHQLSQDRAAKPKVVASDTAGNDSSTSTPAASDAAKSKPPVGVGGFILSVLMLLGLGLVSPFLEMSSSFAPGLLNLFIIFLGIRVAWQNMRLLRPEVDGPFPLTQP